MSVIAKSTFAPTQLFVRESEHGDVFDIDEIESVRVHSLAKSSVELNVSARWRVLHVSECIEEFVVILGAFNEFNSLTIWSHDGVFFLLDVATPFTHPFVFLETIDVPGTISHGVQVFFQCGIHTERPSKSMRQIIPQATFIGGFCQEKRNFKLGERMLCGNLFLGGENDAKSEWTESAIDIVINCANETARGLTGGRVKRYVCLNAEDVSDFPLVMDGDTPTESCLDAIHLIHASLSRGDNVLVHCHAGRNRSATIIVAYIVWCLRVSAVEMIAHIKSVRFGALRNRSFLEQLVKWERYLKKV